MASQQSSTNFTGLLGLLFVALLAVFALADETAAPNNAAPVASAAYKHETSEPVDASDYCSSSTTCSGCTVRVFFVQLSLDSLIHL
jgi:hypothetical protein